MLAIKKKISLKSEHSIGKKKPKTKHFTLYCFPPNTLLYKKNFIISL